MVGGDDDRTIIRPTPGGRRPAAPQPPSRPAAATGPSYAPPAPLAPEVQKRAPGGGLNPLVNAAATLVAVVAPLRELPEHLDVTGLYERIRNELNAFQGQARAAGVRSELVKPASYALCTMLDEVVLNTPWGSNSTWSNQSLLSTFHNEVWGGEKFFQILDSMSQEPARNLELLELLYICLALGFQGKYQVLDGGRSTLERIQDNLYRTIRAHRSDFERELSPRWRGIRDERNPLVRYVPLWVVGALAGALLLALFVGFLFTLNSASDPVFTSLQGIGREKVALMNAELYPSEPEPEPEPDPYRPTLATLLEPEVTQGLIDLVEHRDSTTVVIRGDGLFRSGSATVREEYHPLLRRIGEALGEVEGRVLVTGHTDSIPIRTLRFPSNWHLSQERADAVVSMLAAELGGAERLKSEGRSDTEAVAGNDTPEGRARNRRVEVTLHYQRSL